MNQHVLSYTVRIAHIVKKVYSLVDASKFIREGGHSEPKGAQ